MYKKILTMIVALGMIVAMLPNSVFALSEDRQIEIAMDAVKKGKDTVQLHNDMTADGFLKIIATLLPEDSEVELSFSKESDYRISNASSTKDGSIFANILFTCGVYTRHEIYDIKMPMLTGDSALANADNEKLDEDALNVNNRMKTIAVNNESTKEELLELAREVIKNGSNVEWADDFKMEKSTSTQMGSIKGTLKLTLNSVSKDVTVSKLIRLDIPENANIKRSTPQPKGTEAPENTDKPDATAAPENTPEPTATAAPEKTPAPTAAQKFDDVKDDAYYAAAVKWAVERSITAGTSDTTFSPDDTCTRAQILTFLWRAAGSPKPDAENPFTDVTENDYYYDAAIWASEKGMVEGSTFAGNTPCTRSSTVTYIWISADAPSADTESNEFVDVDEYSDYAEAVAWAVENDVTSGTSDTTFSPDDICSRGQIVTFLNRAFE